MDKAKPVKASCWHNHIPQLPECWRDYIPFDRISLSVNGATTHAAVKIKWTHPCAALSMGLHTSRVSYLLAISTVTRVVKNP